MTDLVKHLFFPDNLRTDVSQLWIDDDLKETYSKRVMLFNMTYVEGYQIKANWN